MKTKLLVALITCLALTACSKSESGKDEKKAGEGTTATQPAQQGSQPAPAGTPHSMNDDATTTTLAADQNAPAQDATTHAADTEKKVEDMKQDMSNTSSQTQGSDASTTTNNTATDNKADTHSHNED